MAKIIIREAKTDLGDSFDVEQLLARGGEILKREIHNIMIEGTGKKLSPTSARDLIAYLRLLHDLRIEQKEAAANLTDEELEQMVKQSENE